MKDTDIRRKLKASEAHFTDEESKVVDELPIGFGDCRIDVAVISGSLHGYEIKSNYDSLYRLERQVEEYRKAFDYLTFVIGDRHIDQAIKIIPDWCGLIRVSEQKDSQDGLLFEALLTATRNTETDRFTVAQFLWKEECFALLYKKQGIRGLSNKNRKALWQMIAEVYAKEELSVEVRKILKGRADWKVRDYFVGVAGSKAGSPV